MPTLGDTFRVYIKPSLDGELVIRKRTTEQTSARLEARKDKLRAKKGTADVPAKRAHDACVAAGLAVKKRVYVPGKGYEERDVCPIKEMKGFLRKEMEAL